jgi:hypothetical protein
MVYLLQFIVILYFKQPPKKLKTEDNENAEEETSEMSLSWIDQETTELMKIVM